ncbi:MAG TPA: NAD(P)-dependent oxidoreductase [Candidatus Binataceae bacterium]|nr:NAD(P)-dependent oxidoreductase [Candidatus Binataceae bacterium]
MIKVGFIGLGEQGKPIAANLAKDGFDLLVHDLRAEPMNEMVSIGAKAASSPREVGAHAEVLEIVVVDDAQVEAVMCGADGVLAGARPGSIVAIHSTIRPATVHRLAARAAESGVIVIDAPVSGGARGAETRTLAFMVGGAADAVARCRPVFEASGKSIFHLGSLGAGMIAKLAHQVIICLNALAAHEGMLLAEKAGLDMKIMQDVVRAGGASSRIADSWVRHRPSPEAGSLWYKDLALALEYAHEAGVVLPGAALTQQMIEKMFANDR